LRISSSSHTVVHTPFKLDANGSRGTLCDALSGALAATGTSAGTALVGALVGGAEASPTFALGSSELPMLATNAVSPSRTLAAWRTDATGAWLPPLRTCAAGVWKLTPCRGRPDLPCVAASMLSKFPPGSPTLCRWPCLSRCAAWPVSSRRMGSNVVSSRASLCPLASCGRTRTVCGSMGA